MGGFAVHNDHETNIQNLYAVGECASIYHGANRLGGNSLLAAMYSGKTAAKAIAKKAKDEGNAPDFSDYEKTENEKLEALMNTESRFPVVYIHMMFYKDN